MGDPHRNIWKNNLEFICAETLLPPFLTKIETIFVERDDKHHCSIYRNYIFVLVHLKGRHCTKRQLLSMGVWARAILEYKL